MEIFLLYQLLRGCGYLHSHVLLNKWLTLADYLYIYLLLPVITSLRSYVGISMISNQPVEGLKIVLQFRPTLFLMIALPVCCCHIDFLYDLSGPHVPNLTVLFCNYLRWKMSTNSLSLFELLTYLAQLSIQIALMKRTFQ